MYRSFGLWRRKSWVTRSLITGPSMENPDMPLVYPQNPLKEVRGHIKGPCNDPYYREGRGPKVLRADGCEAARTCQAAGPKANP